MKYAYRTLVVKRPLSQFSEEERGALIRILTRAEALGNLIVRGYDVAPPGMEYFAKEFKWFRKELARQIHKNRRLNRIHAVFNCQLRVGKEKDTSKGVLVDLPQGVLRLRRIIKGRAIEIKLTKQELKYIRQRVGEGGQLVYAQAWVEGSKLHVALTFRREVEPITPKALIAIDINALHYGVSVGVVESGRLVEVKTFKAPVDRLYKVLKQARKWDKVKGRRDVEQNRKRKARRKAKEKKRAYAIIRNYVDTTVHEIVELARRRQAEIWIDPPKFESVKMLYQKMPRGKKILLAGMRRLVKRIMEQAEWYGLPVKIVHLPSTRCPRCGAEMREEYVEDDRVMVCQCGFIERRDKVPILWAVKKYKKAPLFSYAYSPPAIYVYTSLVKIFV